MRPEQDQIMTASPDSLFLGLDVGSASVRAGLYDRAGRRLAFRARPIRQFRPADLFVEQSSADIWENACAAVREALAEAGVEPGRVAAIGVDATCSLVAVGADGGPVSVSPGGEAERDVIMWMDHRAGEEAALINATRDPALAYVGGEVSIEMELPKVLWLKRHHPDRYAATRRFHDLADHMVWRMTGADVASVCTLGCKWSWLAHEERFPAAMLAAVGLDDALAKVPRSIRPLGSAAGPLSAGAAAQMGLRAGVPVATGVIDAHAGGLALVGADPDGALALIGGTSNCHMVASREPVMTQGVWGPYLGAMVPGWWLAEGGQSAAGALIDWTVRSHAASVALESEARATGASLYEALNARVAALTAREGEPARHLHVLPDHHGNRSPRADALARGAVVGLTLEEGPDALARLYLATIQGLAYGTRHIIERMNAAGHSIRRVVMCGGGTKNPLLLREHADAIGCAIHLVEDEDAVTLGAALLGAVAGGAFPDLAAAARAMARPGATIEPDPARKRFHDAKYAIFLDLGEQDRRRRAAMAAV